MNQSVITAGIAFLGWLAIFFLWAGAMNTKVNGLINALRIENLQHLLGVEDLKEAIRNLAEKLDENVLPRLKEVEEESTRRRAICDERHRHRFDGTGGCS